MLADECPGSGCYGVPLVRPPNIGHGPGKSPRKVCPESEARSKGSFHDQECVTCGTVYISEQDSNGQGRLVPLESSNISTNPPVRATVGQVSIACNINQILSVYRRFRWKTPTSL
jgi:hypothetical protein